MSQLSPVPGYHARCLHIDLSGPTATTTELSSKVLRGFLGGSGLGTYLLMQSDGARIDPLQPSAPIVLAFSPLVGSPITTSARLAIVCRSPLTGRINDSLMGGRFAIAGKQCGCDAMVIRGRAVEPSVLLVEDGQVRLEPAGSLWGMECQDASARLERLFSSDFQSAIIGPAGERTVRYATLSHAGRHAGRGGTGAMFGAKNIKAILLRGSQTVAYADNRKLAALAHELASRSIGPETAKYRELGTAANLSVLNRLHALPTRNFQQGSCPDSEQLSPESLTATRASARGSCVACTIGCEHAYAIRPDTNADDSMVRVEYENLFALGPLCGITEPDIVLAASQRCDQLGIDTISTGGTIAFAMECVQRKLLDAPWLQFGSEKAVLRAIELTASRDGLGNLMAEGSRILAKRLGNNTAAFAPHVKGMELPGYEPRAMQSLALGLAVATRGADHNRSGAAEVDFSPHVDRRDLTPNTVLRAIETENQSALLDSLILCKFLRRALPDITESIAQILQFVTGWQVTSNELHTTANRIVTSKKLFNIQSGWSPAEDTLPERFFEQPLPDDPAAYLSRARFQNAVRAYNTGRGWTSEGWIPQSCIDQLNLNDI